MELNNLVQDDLKQLREEVISEVLDVLKTHESWKQGLNLLKSKELCKILKCSPGTLQNLRRNKILSGIKIGGTIYYSVNEIDSLVNVHSLN